MSDLKLTNDGDLEVVKISDNGVENDTTIISALYDLNTTENYVKDLIIKAVKTDLNIFPLTDLKPSAIFSFKFINFRVLLEQILYLEYY